MPNNIVFAKSDVLPEILTESKATAKNIVALSILAAKDFIDLVGHINLRNKGVEKH